MAGKISSVGVGVGAGQAAKPAEREITDELSPSLDALTNIFSTLYYANKVGAVTTIRVGSARFEQLVKLAEKYRIVRIGSVKDMVVLDVIHKHDLPHYEPAQPVMEYNPRADGFI